MRADLRCSPLPLSAACTQPPSSRRPLRGMRASWPLLAPPLVKEISTTRSLDDDARIEPIVEVANPEAVIKLSGNIEAAHPYLLRLAQDLLQIGVARGQLVRVRGEVARHKAH